MTFFESSCSSVGTGRTAESLAKFPCEMGIVAKAASIGDLAQRLAGAEQRSPTHQMGGVIQTKRIDEFAACRAALRAELLYVAQRDPCFGGDLGRAEIRIGKALPDDAADACEQLVRLAGDKRRIGRRKQCSDEIVDGQLQVRCGPRGR